MIVYIDSKRATQLFSSSMIRLGLHIVIQSRCRRYYHNLAFRNSYLDILAVCRCLLVPISHIACFLNRKKRVRGWHSRGHWLTFDKKNRNEQRYGAADSMQVEQFYRCYWEKLAIKLFSAVHCSSSLEPCGKLKSPVLHDIDGIFEFENPL